ncbi:hypothetical protein F5878DRAFT_518977, partial [Lentinula raphanica]
RHRKPTAKQQEIDSACEETEHEKALRKQQKRERKERRKQEKEVALTIINDGDSDDTKALKEMATRFRDERNAAIQEAETRDDAAAKRNDKHGSIPRPSNMSRVKIQDIRVGLRLGSPNKKLEWNSTRTTIRHAMEAAMLEYNLTWKSQNDRKWLKVYDRAEEAVPALKNFKNQWAVEYIAHQCFGNARSYNCCKGNLGTYRGRKALERLHFH